MNKNKSEKILVIHTQYRDKGGEDIAVDEEIKFLRKFYHNGLFISERNVISFTNTIKYIIKNYNKIFKDISKIKLVSKREYKKNLLLLIK